MLYYTKTIKQCLKELDTDINGLSKTESEERLKLHGLNKIKVAKKPLWKFIIEPFVDVFMAVLFVATVLSLFHDEKIDAIIIISIMLANALIYYIQQYSTNRILKSLERQNNLIVDVLRENHIKQIDSTLLVPGDIVLLGEGDKIPADARLIEVNSFKVDESQLTGESLAVDKQIDELAQNKEIYEQTNMVFQGSFVMSGTATALVVSTGNNTEFGKIAKLSAGKDTKSPVQVKIDKLITYIVKAMLAIAIVAMVLALYRGMDFSDSLRYVLALSVSAVPEGLPVAITVILVVGIRRMARKNALVKEMRAIETIGAITTIASDKTGTLTKNQLTVVENWPISSKDDLYRTIKLSTNFEKSDNHDPLDKAMSEFSQMHSINSKKLRHVATLPFEQKYMMSGNLYKSDDDFNLYVKGAPENIIEICKLSKKEHDEILSKLHSFAGNGFRVIALAYCNNIDELSSFENLNKQDKFTFAGFIAVADVLRPESKLAIKEALNAGINVCMITGDHFDTAYNIGKQLGIVRSTDEVFDCRELNNLSDKELEEKIKNIHVFARVVPEYKYRILTILNKNQITAMTGDGVNDVPALTKAHVGVAMGSGASIAKDAGDIILLDNNFKSIVSAIHEGRTIYANIKRMVAYLVSTNAGEVLISIIALIIGVPMPLVAVQILWVNIATDTCLVIPLGLEPGENSNMNRPPQSLHSPLFSKFMISRIILIAVTMSILVLCVYSQLLDSHGLEYARTVAFILLVTTQWSSALCFRSDYESLYTKIRKPSVPFYIGLSVAVLLQIFALVWLRDAMHLAVISFWHVVYYTLIAIIVPVIVIEVHKYIGRKFFHKGH